MQSKWKVSVCVYFVLIFRPSSPLCLYVRAGISYYECLLTMKEDDLKKFFLMQVSLFLLI